MRVLNALRVKWERPRQPYMHMYNGSKVGRTSARLPRGDCQGSVTSSLANQQTQAVVPSAWQLCGATTRSAEAGRKECVANKCCFCGFYVFCVAGK